MALSIAIKVVIVTEKLIANGVCEVIEQSGATGYTIMAAGGKGSHGVRNMSDRAAVVDDFSDIRIEVIMRDRSRAEALMETIASKYFADYEGITYLDAVEVLRLNKF